MLKQRTLKNSIRATGVGLHSGKKVLMVLRPAPANAGIVFRRTDLAVPVDIPVSPESVTDTRMATTISRLDDPAGVARAPSSEASRDRRGAWRGGRRQPATMAFTAPPRSGRIASSWGKSLVSSRVMPARMGTFA